MSASKKIAVAMSGGVDSSAACALLKAQGYEIIGITLLLKGEADEISRASISDTVKKLGIEHHYFDCRKDFLEKVIIPSAKEYACGRTPNPCCLCNPTMKCAALLEYADKLGIERVATGHYAAIKTDGTNTWISKAEDSAKDQSYFLYRLQENVLKRLIFPLADKTKSEIRAIAENAGLKVFDRPDSQDICFAVDNECCGETLRKAAKLPPCPGRFVYDGKTVGRHSGFHKFTIGQRNGHGIALGKPAYISRINAQNGDIELVTDKEKLACTSFYLKECNQLLPQLPAEGLTVQIRYRSYPVKCRVEILTGDTWQVFPEKPLYAVTPGQAGVLYLENTVAGGGIICL